ncbi:MAG: histidine phosphatase family protein [Solibacillus sp.]
MDHRVVLYLIRHEKTAANVSRRYIGWTDEPIVHQQLDVILPIQPSIVYGSDLLRCQQTASCYFPKIRYKADARLRESDFGQFEMKTYEELKDNLQYRAWIDCPENNPPPDGESFQQFEQRVHAGVMNSVNQAGDYTFVVHGGVIRLLLAAFLQRDFRDVTATHRTLYRIEWDSFAAFKEGEKCKSLSAAPLTVKDIM